MTKIKLLNILIISILSVLLVIFTFFDLTVSELLYNQNSNFAKFFEDFGELPGWLVAPVFFACLFFRFKQVWVKVITAILLLVANYFLARNILNTLSLNKTAFYIILLPLIISLSFLFLLLFKKTDKKTLNILFIIFLFGGLFVLFDNITVQVIKIFWGRVRFYDLNDNFSYWFIPKGLTGNKSFPSGHTTSACALFILIMFCKYFKIKRWLKMALIAFIAVFILQTAVSRIIIGAHYVTDVVFSILLAYILFLIAEKQAKKYIQKEKELQNDTNQN